MKIILEFNLPEENEDFETAKKGPDFRRALVEFSNYLRTCRKYHSEEQLTAKGLTLDGVLELEREFYGILETCEVELN